MKILVTGASGFVGQHLVNALKSQQIHVVRVGRQVPKHDASEFYVVTDFNDACAWQEPLAGCDVVIHLAARVHVMKEMSQNPLEEFRNVNVNSTLTLAKQAKKAGVKRFIFISSVKVNGEFTKKAFNELDIPSPLDAYGKSKLEAEIAVQAFCAAHGMDWVVIRPPLIYGPGVKANVKSLIALCQKPIPLPFALVPNKRSLVSLQNLCSFIALCCHHPKAANQTFLISDDEDVSTAELIRTIRLSLGRRPLLFGLPNWVLYCVFTSIGKTHYSERLLGNLQVDIRKAKTLLGWRPVIGFEAGMRQTVEGYLD